MANNINPFGNLRLSIWYTFLFGAIYNFYLDGFRLGYKNVWLKLLHKYHSTPIWILRILIFQVILWAEKFFRKIAGVNAEFAARHREILSDASITFSMTKFWPWTMEINYSIQFNWDGAFKRNAAHNTIFMIHLSNLISENRFSIENSHQTPMKPNR